MNDFRNLDGWDEDEKSAMQRELAALRSDLNKCNNLSEIRRNAFYDEKSARWAMVDRVRELERENAALRELTSTLGAPNHINVPVDQWREMQADKERLDWIAKNRSVSVTERPLAVTPDSLRAAIDAARKKNQP